MFKTTFLLACLIVLPVYGKHRILMNRIGPSDADLFIANADGTGERKLLSASGFDYNASFSPDGKWIVFTSERGGSCDIYRVRVDGSGLERLTDDPGQLNADPYEGGWICVLRPQDSAAYESLLDAGAYRKLISE